MKKYLSIILAISVILSSFVCIMPAFAYANPASDTDFGITYLWNDDFSSVESLKEYTTAAGAGSAIYNSETKTMYSSSSATYSLTDEGTLKIANSSDAYNYIWTPYILNNAGGQLVLSYDIKFDKTGRYYQGGGNNSQGTDHVFVNYDNKIYAYSSTGNVSTKLYTQGTWMNVTVVYNDANTGTTSAPAYYKDIYINGDYYCTLDNKTGDTSGYTYRDTNKRVMFSFGNYRGSSSMELDNLKVYALPSELKYKVKSISPASAVLEFNAIPTEYATDDFEILNTDGTVATTVSSATLSTTNPREVTINFTDTLSASTDYIIKPSGVKAGTASGDICTDLSVSPSDTGVTVTTGRLDNSVYSDVTEIYNQNFAGLTALPSGTFAPLMYGNASYNTTSRQSLVTESDNAFIRTKGFPANQIIVNTGFLVKNDTYVSADKYILEARVRLNSPDNNAVFRLNESSNMDLKGFPIFANGFIYNTLGDEGLSEIIGTYENNEWMTLTYAVSTAVNENSKYDTEFYLNGQLIQERETDAQPGLTGYAGTANLRTGFYMHGLYKTSADEQSYFDIDYARLIASSSTFGAVIVSDKADCDVDSVTVKFNNLVDTKSLSNAKITLKDSSDTVANVLYIEPVIEANATDYAVKAKLVFDKTLDFNTEYDIYLDDVADINGNKLIFKDTFTTSANKITSFTITNNTANIEMTASDKDLTLVIAAYTVTDGVEQKEGIETATITAGATTGEVSLTNVPDGAEVRAYLLDGFKPIAIASK